MWWWCGFFLLLFFSSIGIAICGCFALVTLHMLFCVLLYNKCAMVNQFKEFCCFFFKFTHQMTHNRYNLIGICVYPFFFDSYYFYLFAFSHLWVSAVFLSIDDHVPFDRIMKNSISIGFFSFNRCLWNAPNTYGHNTAFRLLFSPLYILTR